MKVNMVIHPRPTRATNVCTEIVTLGMHHFVESFHGSLRRLHDLGHFNESQVFEVSRLTVRHNQEVSAVVWIEIHDHEAMLTAPYDKMFVIVLGLQGCSEETISPFLFFCGCFERLDVF